MRYIVILRTTIKIYRILDNERKKGYKYKCLTILVEALPIKLKVAVIGAVGLLPGCVKIDPIPVSGMDITITDMAIIMAGRMVRAAGLHVSSACADAARLVLVVPSVDLVARRVPSVKDTASSGVAM